MGTSSGCTVALRPAAAAGAPRQAVPVRRDRLLNQEVAQKFFQRVLRQVRAYRSDEHFTVDGTLIESWASQKRYSTQVSKLLTEFSSQVLEIAIVITGAFEDFAVRHQAHPFLDLPRLGINLRVVDCNLNFYVPEVRPPKTFGDVQRIRRGFARLIQPCLPVEAAGVDDQGIAIPFAGGIT